MQKTDAEILANNILFLLKQMKMSKSKLAMQSGNDRRTIYNILKQKYSPRLDIISSIAKTLGVTTCDILNERFYKDFVIGALK